MLIMCDKYGKDRLSDYQIVQVSKGNSLVDVLISFASVNLRLNLATFIATDISQHLIDRYSHEALKLSLW